MDDKKSQESETGVVLDVGGKKAAQRRTALPVEVVYESVRQEGEAELARRLPRLFWSGLAAGLSMGFSFVTQGLLQAYLPDAPWRPVVSSLGYSVGFLIVILGRQQLFTENTITPIIQLLHRRDLDTVIRTLRLWAVVLLANLIGAAIFAAVVGNTAVFDGHVRGVLYTMSRGEYGGTFIDIWLRGIFAGWLIALMVWLLPAAETARLWVIIILTYIISLAGFKHIIAGSVDALYVVTAGRVSFLHYLTGFFVSTLLGNILGGVSLVAALNYAQVTTPRRAKTRR
jgi:formate/nitrite transporter FocA (FNT family)